MAKPDTNFGEMVLAEAKKLYGDDYVFDKCTIKHEVVSWSSCDDEPEYGYLVTFETSIIEEANNASKTV